MTRSSLPLSSARLARSLMPSGLQRSTLALALQRRRRRHSGLAVRLRAALLRLVFRASRATTLRFDSAGTIRSFHFLVVATSIGIGLSQLGVRPGHEMMDSRLLEDCADFDRFRPDRVRSKGSYGRSLPWCPFLLICALPPFVVGSREQVSGEASKTIAKCLAFPRSAMDIHTLGALPGPTNAPNGLKLGDASGASYAGRAKRRRADRQVDSEARW
jgi:hypothetical protein